MDVHTIQTPSRGDSNPDLARFFDINAGPVVKKTGVHLANTDDHFTFYWVHGEYMDRNVILRDVFGVAFYGSLLIFRHRADGNGSVNMRKGDSGLLRVAIKW